MTTKERLLDLVDEFEAQGDEEALKQLEAVGRVLAGRDPYYIPDDISADEVAHIAAAGGALDWLKDEPAFDPETGWQD